MYEVLTTQRRDEAGLRLLGAEIDNLDRKCQRPPLFSAIATNVFTTSFFFLNSFAHRWSFFNLVAVSPPLGESHDQRNDSSILWTCDWSLRLAPLRVNLRSAVYPMPPRWLSRIYPRSLV